MYAIKPCKLLTALAVASSPILADVAHGEISQRDQQKAAQRAYEESTKTYNEVTRGAQQQLRDTVNALRGATGGAITGTLTGPGAAVGAAAGAVGAAINNHHR